MGILLAIPISLWLVVLGRHIPALSFFSVLFGDRSDLPSYHDLYQRLLMYDSQGSAATLEKYLESNSTSQVFDRIALPLLQRLEVDRRAGHVSKSQAEFIRDVIESTFEWTPTKKSPSSSSGGNTDRGTTADSVVRSILIAPATSRNDEISAKALARALSDVRNLDVETASTALLAVEIVELLRTDEVDAVVVVGISPYATAKAKLIANRIRQALPNIVIIVGVWKTADDAQRWNAPTDVRNQQFDSLEQTVAYLKRFAKDEGDRENSPDSSNSENNH
jgi:hypothetical protein